MVMFIVSRRIVCLNVCVDGYYVKCKTISEIEECLDCDANANCLNTAGSFVCECHHGYNNSGNGKEGECHGMLYLLSHVQRSIRIKES